MKLLFKKDENGSISVEIQKGLTFVHFDYVEMLKQLIAENVIDCDWGNLDTAEQEKIQELLDRIKAAVEEGQNKPL